MSLGLATLTAPTLTGSLVGIDVSAPCQAVTSAARGRRSVGRRSEPPGTRRPLRSAVVQSASATKRRCRPRLESMSEPSSAE